MGRTRQTTVAKSKKRQKTPAPPARRAKAKKPAKRRKARGRGRGRGRPFEPGNQAAVGHGRPPIPKDYKAAMEDLGPEGVEACGNIVRDPGHPRHADVAMYLVNRWKGTPKARTEISGPAGGPVPIKTVLTSDERRRRVLELAALAAARVAAGTKTGSDGPGGSD